MLHHTSTLFTISTHSSNILLQHDRKLSSNQFVCRLPIYIYIFRRYDLSENACHVDLKEQQFVRRHFLSLWGPVQVDAAGRGPRERKTSVHLFVDCRTPLFGC